MFQEMNEALKNFASLTNNYLVMGILVVVSTVIAAILISRNSTDSQDVSSVKRMVIIGVFSALAFILMYFGIPFILPFLKVEFSFVVIFLIALLIDLKTGVIILAIVSVLDYFIKGSMTGIPIDQFAYFLASIVFLTTVYYLRKRSNVITGVVAGVVLTSVVMTLINFLFITPFYIDLYTADGFWGYVGEPEPANFFMWCVRIYMPFNLTKWGLVALVTVICERTIKIAK